MFKTKLAKRLLWSPNLYKFTLFFFFMLHYTFILPTKLINDCFWWKCMRELIEMKTIIQNVTFFSACLVQRLIKLFLKRNKTNYTLAVNIFFSNFPSLNSSNNSRFYVKTQKTISIERFYLLLYPHVKQASPGISLNRFKNGKYSPEAQVAQYPG